MASKKSTRAQREASRQERARAIVEQQKKRQRRNRIAMAVVALVAVALLAMVLVKVATKPAQEGANPSATKVMKQIVGLPASLFNKIGPGPCQQVDQGGKKVTACLVNNPPQQIKSRPSVKNGLPHVTYVGAEYCPYCAAERWSMVVALSRFGTWAGIGETHSSPSDVYANTATLSFSHSSYTSKYLAFDGYETADVNGAPMDKLPKEEQADFERLNAPPYVPSSSQGSIPFIDFGGKYIVSGASFTPEVLKGKNHEQIAAAMKNPKSPIAQGVVGSANVTTAALCNLTKGQPGSVCNSPGVKASVSHLK